MQDVLDSLLAFARTPLLLGLIALAAILALVLLLLRLRQARAAADVVDPKGSGHLDLDGIEPATELQVLDLRTPAQERAIDRALPRPHLPTARREHVVPAILSLGPQDAGKSTALAHTELRQPQGMPEEAFGSPSPPAIWWSFDRARVLDVAGSLVLEAGDEHSDNPSWRALLRRLRLRRRWRPADGVLLTLAAGELLATLGTDDESSAARSRLADRAAAIRQKLIEAQRHLGMRLPVWVLITQCDAIAGYRVFAHTLLDRERRQIFGWSNPQPLDTAYSASAASDALASLRPVIERLQLFALADPSVDLAPRDRLAFAAFPAALGAVEAPLGIVLNQIFTSGAGYEPLPLRGAYFCGGHGFEEVASPHSLGSLTTTSRTEEPVHTRVDFLSELFSYKIFHEWNLATPTRTATRRAERNLRLARAATLCLAFIGPVALWWTHGQVEEQSKQLAKNFVVPAIVATKLPGRDLDADRTAVCSLLDSAETVEDYRLRTTLLPPSWHSKLEREVVQAATGVYQSVVLPTTMRLIDQRIEALAARETTIVDGPFALCPAQAPSPGGASAAILQDPDIRSAGLPTRVAAADDAVASSTADTAPGREAETAGEAAPGPLAAGTATAPAAASETAASQADPPAATLPALAAGQITDLLTVPAYSELFTYTAATRTVERGIVQYNCFVEARCIATDNDPDEAFSALAETVYGRTMTPPSLASRGFYSSVLARAKVPTDYQPSTNHAARIRDRAERLGISMLETLYGQNVIVQDLDDLERQIRGIEQTPPVADPQAVYQRLLDTIDQAQLDLTRPEIRWMGSGTFDLGPSYNSLIDRIGRSTLLGKTVTGPLDQLARADFSRLRQRLAAYRTTTTGPLLARDEANQPTAALATEVMALRDAIRQLLGEPFMDVPASPESLLDINPRSGTYLQWDVPTLARANALYKTFTTYRATQPTLLTGLAANTGTAARAALETNMVTLIAQAQRFPEQPTTFLTGQRERLIANQVNNFSQAQGSLSDLLNALTHPEGGDDCSTARAIPYCQLSATLLTQQRVILQMLEQVLNERDPYATAADLGGWNGTGNLAFDAFEVADQEALDAKLALARQQVQNLAEQYARPILDGLPLLDPWGLTRQAAFGRFKVILADLDDVEAKKPGNAIALLERFVGEDMANASAASCQVTTRADACFPATTAPDLRHSPPCDYFLEQRNHLVRAVAGGCDALSISCGRQAYRRLADTFEQRAAGRYPFRGPPAAARQGEILPGDLAAVLGRYDQEAPAILRLLALGRSPEIEPDPPLDPCGQWPLGSVPSNDPLRPVHDFTVSLCQVRGFFAGFVAQRAKAPQGVPAFDLQVAPRANTTQEIGGSDVIHWPFAIDGRVADASAGIPARWTFGQPVSQAFVWAKDGPTQPTAPSEANARLEDRSIIFAYEDNWSLLRLLQDNQAPPVDRAFVPAGQQLLRFDIPTVTARSPTSTASGGSVTISSEAAARLYVQVALTAIEGDPAKAGGDSAAEAAPAASFVLPVFPTIAPALPTAEAADGSATCPARP